MIQKGRGQVHASLAAFVLASSVTMVLGLVGPALADPIQGAGSTFAAPVIQEWSRDYEIARTDGGDFVSPDWKVDYEPVGSLAGIMRLGQPELDFAATDVPISPEELKRQGREQFPIVMGGVALVVNLEGIDPGALRIDGPVLADIYLGRVLRWSDPRIKALNPQITLPDVDISVVHRQDGSGSTFALTHFLSAASAEWKQGPGEDTLVDWPIGSGAEGTAALLERVRTVQGSIGYADYGQARRLGLAYAAIQNRAGDFVTPEPAGVAVAAGTAEWSMERGFAVDLGASADPGAYPLSVVTYAVVPVAGLTEARRHRVHDLFRLGLAPGGAEDALALGYVPLPPALVATIEASWARGAVAAQ